ncbi:MAG: aminoglycoside phosphotransferase family protein [Verrucomicrobia bacterium]|nr:aminoglycoside phosphotransferase family protein [Verrucomicrobiota bacterium]
MSRKDVYYWKCDRPSAFHGTQSRGEPDPVLQKQLTEELQHYFRCDSVVLGAGGGQGNHLTWAGRVDGREMFVRVENGPEMDGQLAVESAVLERVREAGVPTPQVYACDASRSRVPFAWQALEKIGAPDLNHWHRQGVLKVPDIAFAIGVAVAKWQGLTLQGFGVLDGSLNGFHQTYKDYYRLRLDQHLEFLVQRGLLTPSERSSIGAVINEHTALLELDQGCFVHKDLALWNILGSNSAIQAFIDFDDAISGDPMDDLSLLACFHDAAFLEHAFDGYQSVRPLPNEHRRRFWLHLLRNMIVKAVIRVGAGYFERAGDFFLLGNGGGGDALRQFTKTRLHLALDGLANNADLSIL